MVENKIWIAILFFSSCMVPRTFLGCTRHFGRNSAKYRRKIYNTFG
jgi:hypothetical protein